MRAWPALLLGFVLGLGPAGPAAADEAGRMAARAVIAKQEQALGRDVLLLLDLVDDESLQRLAVTGLLDLAVAEFLRCRRR